MLFRLSLAWILGVTAAVAQTPPKIVSLDPPEASEVDAKTTKQLVIVFDRPMDRDAFSLCGGGPRFPKFTERPRWRDDRTLVANVELEPEHDYTLGINCPSAQGTKSAEGVSLVPVAWSFSTLPKQLRPAAEQKKRNQQALTLLLKTLAERYSHHDLRIKDWKKLERDATPKVLAAKTDRGFAAAAAEMLRPTQDLHLWLQLGEQVFGTGSRSVDPLFRRPWIEREVAVKEVGKQVLAGRTDDGIGYLMIASWGSELDPEVVGGAITELADTKAMVVDVRPNSGGSELLAQRVAAWFVEGTVTYAKHRYRVRPGKDGFGPIQERQLTGRGSGVYGKPIAVLTSPYVMSSNESFVLMLRQAKDCTVIGQPTFGSSGNPKPFELGNGVTAYVATWQDLRLDGTPFEGEGLQPDVTVPCSGGDLESGDPILAKALEVLRGKVSGK